MRVGHLLVRTAERVPDKAALVEGDVRLTYQQFYDAAARFAGALGHLGVQPGDRVGLLLPNGIPFAVAHFGCLLAGAAAESWRQGSERRPQGTLGTGASAVCHR